jgi:membrane-associated phospholipid phosphatase
MRYIRIFWMKRAYPTTDGSAEGIMGVSRIDLSSRTAGCSRRTLLEYGVAGSALFCAFPMIAPQAVHAAQPGGIAVGRPRTWLLASASELRPAPPAAPTRAELDELLRMQALRSAVTNDAIRRWNEGAGVLPWTAVALDLVKRTRRNPVQAGRGLALLHAAINDAVVAAFDAKEAYFRERPAVVEPAILQQGPITPGVSTFPSEQAAIAGAASTVLIYLFPEETIARLNALATDAASACLAAGANYRSDVAAGLALGRAVGQRAVTRGQTDGSDREWDGTRLHSGEGYWAPTPPRYIPRPLEPLAGSWRTWAVPNVAALRPLPPPSWGTPEWAAQLDAVRQAVAKRTQEQAKTTLFWAGNDGTVSPAGLWLQIARDMSKRDRLNTLQTAQAMAMTSIAIADAFICCWDAKYTYWSARPIQADITLDIQFPTPPFPSYTSGHATISGAAATVLGHIFPNDADDLDARAVEAKNSRLWAGFHYPIDNDVGLAQGRQIGRLVVETVTL